MQVPATPGTAECETMRRQFEASLSALNNRRETRKHHLQELTPTWRVNDVV